MIRSLKFIPTDAVLVRYALSDDAGALEALVLRHARRAHAVARSVGIPPSVVDDVVQEGFLRALRELHRLHEPGAFGPWFLSIVRNTARD